MSNLNWTIADGAMFWSIAPSVEAENCNEHWSWEPWLGKLRVVRNAGGTVLYLHRIDPKTGEVRESNGSRSLVSAAGREVALDKNKVFLSELDAWKGFAEQMLSAVTSELRIVDTYNRNALRALRIIREMEAQKS